MNIASKTKQKIVLSKHFKSFEHLESFRAEGMRKAENGLDKKSDKKSTDVEVVAGYIRICYSLFKQEVEFSKFLFIVRAFLSTLPPDTPLRLFGHLCNRSIREVLRIISNHIRGYVDMMLVDVKYIGSELDDGTDSSHLSHLLLFDKVFWPPPSCAEPSRLPVLTSYKPLRLALPPPRTCDQCGCKDVTTYVCCSNDHVTCASCAKKKVRPVPVVIAVSIINKSNFLRSCSGGAGDPSVSFRHALSLPPGHRQITLQHSSKTGASVCERRGFVFRSAPEGRG